MLFIFQCEYLINILTIIRNIQQKNYIFEFEISINQISLIVPPHILNIALVSFQLIATKIVINFVP